MNRMKQTLIGVLIGISAAAGLVSAQTPTLTFEDAMATQTALENAIDALPVIEILPAIEVTESPDGDVTINIDTQPDAAPADVTPVEPAPAGVPTDTVHIALVVGGIVALAIIGVAAFLLKTTGEQLYNSLPPIAQYGVRAGGEYLLHEAAKTPPTDDDAAIESALRALGFVVVRADDGTITLRRPAPAPVVIEPVIAQTTTAVPPQTTVTFTGTGITEADVRRIVEERYALGTPLTPQQPSPEAVQAFVGDATPSTGVNVAGMTQAEIEDLAAG